MEALEELNTHIDDMRREDLTLPESLFITAVMSTEMDTTTEAFMALMTVLWVKHQMHQGVDNGLIHDLRERFEKLSVDVPLVREIYSDFDREFNERHKALERAWGEAERRVLHIIEETNKQRVVG